jgi:hypothetical protein
VEIFIILNFIIVVVIALIFMGFGDDLDTLSRIGLMLLLLLNFAIGWGQVAPLPGTDATIKDMRDMISECQVDLPRSQKCVIDIMVRPE